LLALAIAIALNTLPQGKIAKPSAAEIQQKSTA
jgi:hypothetical protein